MLRWHRDGFLQKMTTVFFLFAAGVWDDQDAFETLNFDEKMQGYRHMKFLAKHF